MNKQMFGGGCNLSNKKAPSTKNKNFIYRDIKEINIILLILIGIFIISMSSLTSYALFSYEETSPFTIKAVAGKISYPTPAYCFEYETSGTEATITDYLCYEGNSNGYETITDVLIPETLGGYTVTVIGVSDEMYEPGVYYGSFQEKNLTSVVIPDSVTTIGSHAFSYNNLTSVIIPDSVTTIGDSAFGYNNLTSVNIPDSVTTIGDFAFRNNNLTSVTLGNGVTTIEVYAFSYNNLTSITIPDSVTTIEQYAFSRNSLTSVVIGENSNLTETTGIGIYAFTSSNRTITLNEITYVDNPNLTIYNNSEKTFKWYYVTQGINNYTSSTYNFVTGTVPSYTLNSTTYNSVTITTGYPE